MMLDSNALADQAWRDLEIAADATGRLEVARVTLPIEKVRALVEGRRSALPAGEVGELVAELRNEAFRHELQHLRSSVEIDHLFQKAATALTSLSARIEALEDALEHVTELLVDTWHVVMPASDDPEKDIAVINARAALSRRATGGE